MLNPLGRVEFDGVGVPAGSREGLDDGKQEGGASGLRQAGGRLQHHRGSTANGHVRGAGGRVKHADQSADGIIRARAREVDCLERLLAWRPAGRAHLVQN